MVLKKYMVVVFAQGEVKPDKLTPVHHTQFHNVMGTKLVPNIIAQLTGRLSHRGCVTECACAWVQSLLKS